ncbi:PREDICTED: uncharacterized protein LOC104818362 isoform X3 [Tarenaya hassleriana]|uniref:uncharacterized protein LOC104818362 isoform X3 n=1 Tax=Tarenaya hassleriana TaxID=28532 RepID=UPI00053C0BB8|nr:PREDICTED: uncharacterized protein LOC104818362 isoform X3 [Tarenaya hassleriana]
MFLPSLPCFGESNHRMSNDSTMPPPSTDSNSDAVQLSENPPFPPHLNTSDTISAGRASSPQQAVTELSSRNGVADRLSDEIPELPQFSVLDSKAYADKYRKYESEYTQMLMAKYFSVKNIYGGNIFEEKTMIGGETIMSSSFIGGLARGRMPNRCSAFMNKTTKTRLTRTNPPAKSPMEMFNQRRTNVM